MFEAFSFSSFLTSFSIKSAVYNYRDVKRLKMSDMGSPNKQKGQCDICLARDHREADVRRTIFTKYCITAPSRCTISLDLCQNRCYERGIHSDSGFSERQTTEAEINNETKNKFEVTPTCSLREDIVLIGVQYRTVWHFLPNRLQTLPHRLQAPDFTINV